MFVLVASFWGQVSDRSSSHEQGYLGDLRVCGVDPAGPGLHMRKLDWPVVEWLAQRTVESLGFHAVLTIMGGIWGSGSGSSRRG